MIQLFFRFAALLCIGFWADAARPDTADTTAPGILIFIADDLNRDSLPCYGNPDAVTPHIDRLAAEGWRFNNAYTSTAMCAPTRAQLYTGLFPVRNGAWPNHSRVRQGITSMVHDLKALGYRVGINGKRHFKPAASFPFEDVGGNSFNAEAIKKFMHRDRDQPFCLVVASHSPHVPWTEGDPSLFKEDSLSIPPYWLDTPAMRQALTRYYAELHDLDRELGLCLDFLEESGLSQNTLVIFSTEQGAQIPGGKWTCYENGLKIGLLMRWPSRLRAGQGIDAWVHHVDIRPTLVELAGGEADPDLDGESLVPLLDGRTDHHRSVIYGVHTQLGAIGSPTDGYPVRSIRSGPYKLILNLNHHAEYSNALTTRAGEGFWQSWLNAASEGDPRASRLVSRYLHRPPMELYHLTNDPHELDNLAGDPLYRGLRDDLSRSLLQWMESQGDAGIETEKQAPARK